MNEHDNKTEDTPVIDTNAPVTEAVDDVVAVADSAAETVVEEVKEAVGETVEEKVEVVAPVVEATVAEAPAVTTPAVAPLALLTAKVAVAKKFLWGRKYTIAAVVLVVIALLGLLFLMEQQGRINTGIFDGVQSALSKNKAVVRVNDGKVTQYDLDVSMSQISTGAAAQGADIESEDVKKEIQSQAIDMLVNTELLKQEASSRGIEVTGDDVEARLETLKTDVGGAEVLEQRMKEFNIDEKTLRRDIKNELTIQKLLEQIFAEKEVAVSEEEVVAFYEQAGGTEAGLPALDEVRAQIETQIKTSKEQEVVTAYIEELRAKATIEVLI